MLTGTRPEAKGLRAFRKKLARDWDSSPPRTARRPWNMYLNKRVP